MIVRLRLHINVRGEFGNVSGASSTAGAALTCCLQWVSDPPASDNASAQSMATCCLADDHGQVPIIGGGTRNG